MKYLAIPIEGYYVMVSDQDYNDYKCGCSLENIIAQSQNVVPDLPLFDAPWEEDVEKQYIETANNKKRSKELIELFSDETREHARTFKNGYNAAKAKYKWTDKDIEKAFNFYRYRPFPHGGSYGCMEFPEFLQSLKKPKVYEVEIEMETVQKEVITNRFDKTSYITYAEVPKITNNKINILKWEEIK